MKVIIQSILGKKSVDINVNSSDTILSLKSKVDFDFLYLNRTVLETDKLVSDYDISEGTTLYSLKRSF